MFSGKTAMNDDNKKTDAVSVYVKKEKREKKTPYIIISIIIAFALWFYVIQGENPVLQRTFSDINVQMLNKDVLESNGYRLLTPDDQKVSVTIEGKRSILVMMEKSSIFASVDVSQCTEGEQYLDVRAYRPSGGEIADVNPSHLKIMVDKLVSEEFEVEIMFNGNISPEYEAVCTDQSTDTVTVTGARSEVNRIERVSAEINADDLTEESKDFVTLIAAYDKDNKIINDVSLSENEVEVQAQLYNVKNVELNVKTTGTLPENLYVEGINVPDFITVIGLYDDIADISSIDTLPVDMSEIKETTTLLLEPVLPKGVELSGRMKEIRATIRVGEKASKVISYPTSDIIVENLYEAFNLTFENNRTDITINGTVKNISEVTEGKLTVKVDAASVKEGKNTLTPKVTVDVSGAEGTADNVVAVVTEK